MMSWQIRGAGPLCQQQPISGSAGVAECRTTPGA